MVHFLFGSYVKVSVFGSGGHVGCLRASFFHSLSLSLSLAQILHKRAQRHSSYLPVSRSELFHYSWIGSGYNQ